LERRSPWCLGTLLLLAATGIDAAPASADGLNVAVVAKQADIAEGPVSVEVPAELWKKRSRPAKDAVRVPCQVDTTASGKLRLTFLVKDLRAGERRVYRLDPAQTKTVDVRPKGKDLEIWVGEKLFTRYDVSTGPTKPFFYPIQAFDRHLTRRWPLEDVAGEEKDHPHHRGLWFTHGLMNGVDFWAETGNAHPIGKTVHTGFSGFSGGAVQGGFVARTDWNSPEGKTLARDTRTVRITPLPSGGILLDFEVAVQAVGPLVWGDTKEGSFAIRVPESMKADKGGTLVNAEGLAGAKLWGKPSPWNDYHGPVDGETLGVAILDHPSNPRHPTTWHSRTYGLFAVNPFGLHDFDPALKSNKSAGDLVQKDGESVVFRYRVYFHRGDTTAAKVGSAYSLWTNTPVVEVL
jgi:hypothetical protein